MKTQSHTKTYSELPDFTSQEYNDLNHILLEPNQNNNSITDLSEEISLVEIIKMIENPEEHISSELPQILENLLSFKKFDESNINTFLIADLSRILIQHLKWVKCFPNIKPFYKVHSNNNLELLKILKKLGINFICSDESEIEDIINLDNENSSLIINSANSSNLSSFNINQINSIDTNSSSSSSNNNNNINLINLNAINKNSNTSTVKIILNKTKNSLISNLQNEYSESFIKFAEMRNFNYALCEDLKEAEKLKLFNPNVKILLKIFVNSEGEITRSEKNRMTELFEQAEELEISDNIKGISLELEYTDENLCSKKIYELIKKAREIFDLAEEYGIEMNFFDIGSPENENFFNEENLKIISESLGFFFSDLNVEFIAQLGKFFCSSAFTLVTRNIRKLPYTSELNLIGDSSVNNQIGKSESNSSTNLIGLNSTDISSNISVSAINQNSSYYFDLDFPEENMNTFSISSPIEENSNFNNNNFCSDFILNNSIICETGNSNNLIAEQIKFNEKNEKKSLSKSEEKNCFSKICCGNDLRNIISENKNLNENFSQKKIKCEIENCIREKIENIYYPQNSFEDWFVFENMGDHNKCQNCKLNGYIKPDIIYINNRFSIKLEKYFYVIMNKFDS